MKLKLPLILDTSHWEKIPDFAQCDPRPVLVITKATEGTSYIDPTLATYMTDLKQDGIERGVYHFHRKALDSSYQAQHFYNTIKSYIDVRTILALDIEEGGETAGQLVTFLKYVKRVCPSNPVFIYSTKYLLEQISLNAIQSERDYLRTFPIWTAGYPTYPDDYSSVPAKYTPDPRSWGPVYLWQYSDKAIITGINDAVDVNWGSPELISWLGYSSPNEVHTIPFFGADRYYGKAYGWNYIMTLVDTKRVIVKVVHHGGVLRRPSEVAKETGAAIAWNGTEWSRSAPVGEAMPLHFAVSDGNIVTPYNSYNPFLNIRQDGTAEILHDKITGYQTTSGFRYIVLEGQNTVPVYSTRPEETERHARTVRGIHADGRMMTLSVNGGKLITQGVTLWECAELMRKYGAVKAFDADSGSSTTDVLNGYNEVEPAGGTEAYTVQTVLVFEKEKEQMPYEATAIGDGTRLRPDHNTNNTYIAQYPKGTIFAGANLFTATQELKTTLGVVYQKPGDVWLETITPRPGWVAIINMGSAICTLKTSTPPPVDTNMPEYYEISMDACAPDGTIIDTYTGRVNKVPK